MSNLLNIDPGFITIELFQIEKGVNVIYHIVGSFHSVLTSENFKNSYYQYLLEKNIHLYILSQPSTNFKKLKSNIFYQRAIHKKTLFTQIWVNSLLKIT